MIIPQLQDKLRLNCQTSTTKMRIPMIHHKMYSDGTQRWHLNDKIHRECGPAVIHSYGYQAWCLNGEYHRTNGPAIIYANGLTEWWLNGKTCEPFKFNIKQLQFNIRDGF